MLNIVLVEPEIPQNTGNIARTCAALGARLHLVKPMGFEVNSAKLKRAGLDYWKFLDITYYESLQEFLNQHKEEKMYFLTTKAKKIYSDASYPDDVYLLFGKETKGLPEWLLRENYDKCIRIPMINDARSLNLSNAVAIVAYEYFRQKSFIGLNQGGFLNEEG